MKVYTIPFHDKFHFNVMLVLQSCTDSLQVLAASYCESFPSSYDGAYDIGNINFVIDGKEVEE